MPKPAPKSSTAAKAVAEKPAPAKPADKRERKIIHLTLPLDQLKLVRVLQRREQESKETIARYAELFAEQGIEALPPVVAFTEDPKAIGTEGQGPILVADGFHRYKGAHKADLPEIRVEVRKGTQRDALLYALGANADHGLPLTLTERRANAEALLADEEWRGWSDREISTHVHLSPNTIGKLRKTVAGAEVEQRRGKDGVVRKKAEKKTKFGMTDKALKSHLLAAEDALRDFGRTSADLERCLMESLGNDFVPTWSDAFEGALNKAPGVELYRGFWFTCVNCSQRIPWFNDCDWGDRVDGVDQQGKRINGWLVGIDPAGSAILRTERDERFSARQQPADWVQSGAPTAPADPKAPQPATAPQPAPTNATDELRQLAAADAKRLIEDKLLGLKSDLVARIIAALYHLDSRNEAIGLARLAAVCGHPEEMLGKMIGTVAQVEVVHNAGMPDAYVLRVEIDQLVDEFLTAEPEEVRLEGDESGEQQAQPADEPARRPRTTAPLADRRARWIQDHLAEQIEGRGNQLECSEAEISALSLLVGIDTDTEDTWDEVFVQNAVDIYRARLAAGIARRIRERDTRALPDWRVLAGFYCLDPDAIAILAQRAIPE